MKEHIFLILYVIRAAWLCRFCRKWKACPFLLWKVLILWCYWKISCYNFKHTASSTIKHHHLKVHLHISSKSHAKSEAEVTEGITMARLWRKKRFWLNSSLHYYAHVYNLLIFLRHSAETAQYWWLLLCYLADLLGRCNMMHTFSLYLFLSRFFLKENSYS